MKILSAVSIFSIALVACAQASPQDDLQIKIKSFDRNGTIVVTTENTTDKNIDIWSASNFGGDNLRVIVLRQKKAILFAHHGPPVTKIIATVDALSPHQSIDRIISLNTGEWLNSVGESGILRDGDEIVLIYKNLEPGYGKAKVWSGTILCYASVHFNS